MIAAHADKVVAGRYSLVGSTGATMSAWQIDKALSKLDVSPNVYASGKLKAFLTPGTALTPEANAKAQGLVNQLGGKSLAAVKRRGSVMKQGVDYATSEVWSGAEAMQLGLVDQIATLGDYVDAASRIEIYDFGPKVCRCSSGHCSRWWAARSHPPSFGYLPCDSEGAE